MTNCDATPGPYHETAIAKYLRDHRANHPEIPDREIARHLGYDRDDVVAGFRNGQLKLPLDKATSLAEVLKADPVAMTRLALEQHGLLRRDALGRFFDRMATVNELVLLDAYRRGVGGADYALPRETVDAIEALITEGYRRLTSGRHAKLKSV